MSFRNFTDEIKKGLSSANYLLVSSDYFLHTEAVSLIKGLVPQGERDFNFHSFDLLSSDNDKLPLEQILDVLNTASFFSGRKFVVIENVQKLLEKGYPEARELSSETFGRLGHDNAEFRRTEKGTEGETQWS